MSGKLLQALTDENPDLKKQIGCMAGIFQLFDRHHILSGKSINSHAHKRLPPGHSQLNESRLRVEPIPSSPQRAMEKNWCKNVNENQRNSVESSRASFSSSSCSSSFSSLDCSKTAQSDPPSLERTTLLEKSPRSPSKPKNTDINSRPNHALCQDQPNTYSPSGRESIDLRDVVKDSIYRDHRALSVKTMTREEPMNHVLKHRDSPRPLQPSKSVDGSYAVEVHGKPDLHKSPRVLGKLKEAPWNLSEVRKPPGSLCETKDSSSFSVSKDTPRLSYDGRERPRRSFDYKDAGSKSTMKLKEPPRLSLDSRAGSMRSSNFDSKPGKSSPILALNPEQGLGCNKRPPSVVAKLMGLEVMPNSSPAAHRQMGWMKASPEDNHDIFNGERNTSRFSRRSKETEEGTKDRSSWSPKTNSFKDPVSPRRRNPDSAMKPISNSRFPIETAPWRQSGRGCSQKTALSNQRAHERPQTSLSVYSEIKKRLEELEFPQSGKDIRDLKQMLDAIQVNGQLEKKTEEDGASCFEKYNNLNPVQLDQNPRLANKHNMRSSRLFSSPIKASSNTASSFDSPIVIMKPEKFIDKSRFPASSVIPLDEFSSLHKLRTGDSVDSRRVSVNTRTLKDPTPKLSLKVPSNFVSKDKKTNGKTVDNTSQKPRTRLTLISSRPQPLTLERTGGSSAKSLGSSSPRFQQKKLQPEKQSHSPIPSVDLSKPRRKPLRQLPELGSPGGRHRAKSAYSQRNDDQLSDISSETRILSHHDDDISVQSDSNIGLNSQVDVEVTSANLSADMNIQPSNQSPSQRAANTMVSSLKQKKSLPSFGEDDLSVKLATVAPEQPSPVSVLDASFYKDDLLPSPVKKMENTLLDDDTQNSDVIYGEEGWNRMDLDSLSASRHADFSSQINHKKWEKIECLVHKLRRLNSGHDEISKDHIASLCENTNPDHRYISEVLLASGLLLKDFSSGTPQIQLHSSGQLINPDLFLVLEQTKISWLSKTEPACESILRSKAKKDKLKRKLMFDVVNEILIQKLALNDSQREPWILPSKIAGEIPSGQRLLKELCSEIDLLKPDKLKCNLDDNSIVREDVMHRAESWKDFHKELSGLVLDIERLIFKDLVDEIVSGELLRVQAKQNRQRRQLFAK
ncbi:hypothetical protein AAC387_Pa05g1620 [Persea americana]